MLNEERPRELSESGNVTDSSPLHPENVSSSIITIEFGILNTPVNPLHSLNADAPMLVTELGIYNSPVMFLQSLNASEGIIVTF